MDRALQLALRDYAYTNSDEDAHRVANLLRRTIDDRIAAIPAKSRHGNLTYAGLLRTLLDLTDSQLGDDVTHYNSADEEWRPATDFFTNDDLTDVLDTGHGILIDIRCDNCGETFDSERALRHFLEPDLDDICDNCPPLPDGPFCPNCGHQTAVAGQGGGLSGLYTGWECLNCGTTLGD